MTTNTATTAHRPKCGRHTTAARRCLYGASGVGAALCAIAPILDDPVAAGHRSATISGCTVTPAADDLSIQIDAMLGTIRVVAGQLQMLYDVHCPDGHLEHRWIVERE